LTAFASIWTISIESASLTDHTGTGHDFPFLHIDAQNGGAGELVTGAQCPAAALPGHPGQSRIETVDFHAGERAGTSGSTWSLSRRGGCWLMGRRGGGRNRDGMYLNLFDTAFQRILLQCQFCATYRGFL